MRATERAAQRPGGPTEWSVVWPTPAVVALGVAVAALPLGLFGFDAAWLLVVLLALALGVSPLLARAEVRATRCVGPLRLTLDAGNVRVVPLECQGRARDVLVRIGARERLGRAPWAALAPGPAGGSTALAEVRVARRGRSATLALEVASTFPFGLCEVRERRTLPCETVVRPRPLAPGPWLRAALAAQVGDTAGATLDPVGDFHALVEWRPGEPLRRLHAGASLRRGRLVRIEAMSAGAGTVTVALGAASGASAAAFERSVSAATRLVLALEHSGRRLVLRPLDGTAPHPAAPRPEPSAQPTSRPTSQPAPWAIGVALGARAALDALAVVTRAPLARPLAELVSDAGRAARGSGPTLVVAAVSAVGDDRPPRVDSHDVVLITCEATGAPQVSGGTPGRRRASHAGPGSAVSR